MDEAEARLVAIAILDDVLAGQIERAGDLVGRWPRAWDDALMRRARQEAMHYLMTGGDLERAIVVLLRRFLEKGGSQQALDRAYDEVIGRHPGSADPACPGESGPR